MKNLILAVSFLYLLSGVGEACESFESCMKEADSFAYKSCMNDCASVTQSVCENICKKADFPASFGESGTVGYRYSFGYYAKAIAYKLDSIEKLISKISKKMDKEDK